MYDNLQDLGKVNPDATRVGDRAVDVRQNFTAENACVTRRDETDDGATCWKHDAAGRSFSSVTSRGK